MATLALVDDAINSRAFWTAIGARPLGATIVTAQVDGIPSGFLGLSFAHVSADPPTVLVSISRRTGALAAIRSSEAFAVSVLPSDSEEIAKAFGGAVSDTERFTSHRWDTLATGAPILVSAAAAFDCRLRSVVEEDAAIVAIGRVVGLQVASDRGATVAYQGSYKSW